MRYFILSLSILLLASSCQKTPAAEQSNEDILMNGKWVIAGGTVTVQEIGATPRKDTVEQILDIYPDCIKSKYLTFEQNAVGYLNSSSTKCSPSDPDKMPFNWSLMNGGTVLNILNATSLFDTSDMVATMNNFSRSGFNITYTYILKIPITGTDSNIYDTTKFHWIFKNTR